MTSNRNSNEKLFEATLGVKTDSRYTLSKKAQKILNPFTNKEERLHRITYSMEFVEGRISGKGVGGRYHGGLVAKSVADSFKQDAPIPLIKKDALVFSGVKFEGNCMVGTYAMVSGPIGEADTFIHIKDCQIFGSAKVAGKVYLNGSTINGSRVVNSRSNLSTLTIDDCVITGDDVDIDVTSGGLYDCRVSDYAKIRNHTTTLRRCDVSGWAHITDGASINAGYLLGTSRILMEDAELGHNMTVMSPREWVVIKNVGSESYGKLTLAPAARISDPSEQAISEFCGGREELKPKKDLLDAIWCVRGCHIGSLREFFEKSANAHLHRPMIANEYKRLIYSFLPRFKELLRGTKLPRDFNEVMCARAEDTKEQRSKTKA